MLDNFVFIFVVAAVVVVVVVNVEEPTIRSYASIGQSVVLGI